ncbi:RNA polymerase subunit sigma-24 [Mycobacterium sp. 852002-50816_SCH5313054-b]|uniref:RNA polymerase sigma-70 factor n=1 Tax=Mycobacterium sp. 852002-50816_SCH5313054-b TaxID=1834092 RepID=UPI000800566F|nr:RNA polymerase sigma-70 factor [Mycobacterium sp. 852002-50816_SCH5313054-b]OBF63639.1 RNA polymerase subunit sigma-24 [Mycobacterium sp. 852002-50816_SCH5313054-b]
MSDLAEAFESQRPRLFWLAYRMLGSASEAEDAVQDAYLRLHGADAEAIESLPAWLTKAVTNLCLNRLTSARARREVYPGPWLPEPVLTDDPTLGPLETAEQRESVSIALLGLMERLNPTERAAFVLREAFAYSHCEIAEVLQTSEANARQLYRRARQRLGDPRQRVEADRAQWRRLVDRFLAAAGTGDVAGLVEILTANATSTADGGGKVAAARRPISGRDRVASYVARAFGRNLPRLGLRLDVREVNGEPAMLAFDGETLAGVLCFEIEGDQIAALRAIANPDKLRFLAEQLSHPAGLPGS